MCAWIHACTLLYITAFVCCPHFHTGWTTDSQLNVSYVPSLEVEVANYSGLPLPAPNGHTVPLKLIVIGYSPSQWKEVDCFWALFTNYSECNRTTSGVFLVELFQGVFIGRPYGVHQLVVTVSSAHETKNTPVLLRYEQVDEGIKVLSTYQTVRETMLNATLIIGSNQINEWILPSAFCYGQSVALNFSSGYFYLYSSNGVKTVLQSFLKKLEDTGTTVTTISTTESAVSTTGPAVSTTGPAISTTESAISTTGSAISTTESAISTIESAISATESAISTNGPAATQRKDGDPARKCLPKRRNIQFPFVELYAPDETQINVSTEVFIASNTLEDIHPLIRFGDGNEKRVNSFSRSTITSHIYQQAGNLTMQLHVLYRNQSIFVTERSIMVLDRNCFQPTSMFDIQHSVPSNPLTVFTDNEIVIKSRKRYRNNLEGCNPQPSGHVIYSWELTNADTTAEKNTTIGQLMLTSQMPGLWKISLRILAGKFSTSGILYANFIFPQEIDIRANITCQEQTLMDTHCSCDYAVDIQLLTGRNFSYIWVTAAYIASSEHSLTQIVRADSTWKDLLYQNSTDHFDLSFPPSDVYVIGIHLIVNLTSSTEDAFQFVKPYKSTGCGIRNQCLQNCKFRTSLSRTYKAKIMGSCVPVLKSYDIVDRNQMESPLINNSHHNCIHFDSGQVAIDTSKLVAGKDYVVRVLTNIGLWMIYLNMNTPPIRGYCDVIPKEGLVLETEFVVSCREWKSGSEDYSTPEQPTPVPLLYSVWYRTSSTDRVMVYQGYESSTTAFVLPSGSPAESYLVAIDIEAEDRFGDKTGLNTSVSVKIRETSNGDYVDTLVENLRRQLAKFYYNPQPDSQIHAIQITAKELNKIQINDSFPNMTDLKSMNISDLMNRSEDTVLQNLKQASEILSNSTLYWMTNSFLRFRSTLSDMDTCHMMLLCLDSLETCTRKPEITTLESTKTIVSALDQLISSNILQSSILKDASTANKTITGLMKVIDKVFLSYYHRYFDDVEESLTMNTLESAMTGNNAESTERTQLIGDYLSSERRQTIQKMQALDTSSERLMTSLSAIGEMMKATMTERKVTENHEFVSYLIEKVDVGSIRNYSVGGIPLSLHTGEIPHTDVNISIATFKKSPFSSLNDSSIGSSGVVMLHVDVDCNVSVTLRNREMKNMHKKDFPVLSSVDVFQEFDVNFHDLTLIHLDFRKFSESVNLELYIKGGTIPTKTNFDIRYDVQKDQTIYPIPAGRILHKKGYLKILVKDTKRRRKRRHAAGNNGAVGVQVFTAGCRSNSSTSWIPGDCKVDEKSSLQYTVCRCPLASRRLNLFTSTFYVQPNLIDFSTISHFTKFDVNNAAVYGTLIVMLCLYVILVIVLRRQDHKDTQKWVPQFLCDNGENDHYFYMITVYTGMRRGSATMSNVNFILAGEEDDSGIRVMSDSYRIGFNAGSVRRFIMSSPSSLGTLNYLRIWHDNSGTNNMQSWFLNKVVVDDLQTKERSVFHCGRWLSLARDDGRTERVLPVCTMAHLNSFNTQFSEQTQLNLTDSHLLVSTLIRPESSNFSRVQRLSCLFVLMLLSMISHAMYFKENPDVSPSQVNIGSLSFSLKDLYVSFIVVLITTPPILCASFLFKKTAKRPYNFTQAFSRRASTSSQKYTATKTKVSHGIDLNCMFDTEKTLFPRWVLFIAWLVLLVAALASAFFLLWYSLAWGKEKSTKWLINFFLSSLESIFIVDPAKVLAMALVGALFLKSKETRYKLNMDLRHLRRLANGFYNRNIESLNVLRRQILGRQEPSLNPDVENFKKRRQEEIKARRIFMELLTYSVFAFLVFSISYIHKDQRSFLLKHNIYSRLVQDPVSNTKFAKMNKTSEYYGWLKTTLLPQLYPSRDWKNATMPPSPWFGDWVNIRIGTAKLRQVRITEEPCMFSMYHIVRPCIHGYQTDNMETRDFYSYWKLTKNVSQAPQILDEAWKYSAEEDGIYIPGEIHTYNPGGYTIIFPDRLTEALKLVDYLENSRWVDRHTRALFLEFNLYNPNINIFTYAMFIGEFVETGGLVTRSNIWIFRPNEFTGAMGTYSVLCYLLFLIFLAWGTFKVIKQLCQERLAFFKQPWNMVDTSCIVLSYVGIVTFSIRLVKAIQVMSKFKDSLSKGYFVDFQSVFLWDYALNCIIGILTFITTLRVLRILGYNRRLTEIVRVITSAARDLIGFGFVFVIIYIAYVLFGFLIFGKSLSEYKTVFESFGTLTNSLIGKNRLDMMIHVAPQEATFFYFTYTLCVIFTLLTTFSAILNYSIMGVRQQSKNNPEMYGVLNILGSSISNLFGIATAFHSKDKSKPIPNTEGKLNLQGEKIDVIGIVKLIKDIFVQSLGKEFLDSIRRSSLKTENASLKSAPPTPPTPHVRHRPRCLDDLNRLERINTLRDIQVSIERKEQDEVQQNLRFL